MNDLSMKQFIAPIKIDKPDDSTIYFQDLQDIITQLQQTINVLNDELNAFKGEK